jgi:hypothetical protein
MPHRRNNGQYAKQHDVLSEHARIMIPTADRPTAPAGGARPYQKMFLYI